MARPKKNQQAPFAPGGTQTSGASIIFRERAIEGLGSSIQMLEDEANYQRQMLNTLTEGGTLGRQGKAGGFQVGRSSSTIGAAGGAMAWGDLSYPQVITQLLSEHREGLTAKQIKELTAQVGRKVHATYPHDSLTKLRAKHMVNKRGEGATAKYFLKAGTGVMARAGEPQTGRQKKGAGRAKTMQAGA